MPNLSDLNHWWNNDLQLSPTGDLALCDLTLRSQQRILRRLLTNPGEYLMHATYGAGLPTYIGAPAPIGEITGIIRGQMLLEESVLATPEPQITITPIPNGISAKIPYTVAPAKTPTVLDFSLTE